MIIYALGVLVGCFVSIWFLRSTVLAVLVVVLWTLLGPVIMQLLVILQVGYLDPFWKWASAIQALVAFVASMVALGARAVIDEVKNSS